jgi:twitching motility protein PilT
VETTPYAGALPPGPPSGYVYPPTGIVYPPGMEPPPELSTGGELDQFPPPASLLAMPAPQLAPPEPQSESAQAFYPPPAWTPEPPVGDSLPATNSDLLPPPASYEYVSGQADPDTAAPDTYPALVTYPPLAMPVPESVVAAPDIAQSYVAASDVAESYVAALVVEEASVPVTPAMAFSFAEPEAPVEVRTLDPLIGHESKAAGRNSSDRLLLEVDPVLPEPQAQVPGLGRATTEQVADDEEFSLTEVLGVMLERNASDLHLTSNAFPTIRISGSLVPMEEFLRMTPDVLQRTLYGAITQIQREKFEEKLELDFAYTLPGRARFRVNMYRQRDSVGAVFRVIPFEIKSLESLGVPPAVANFASLARGFVLVTGPTGSGKSTTLAAVVDLANRTRSDHIMTVEDPIEFLHKHKQCLVNQREVGEDTWSFSNALKHVLRQDPDIILVGEMRDLETISVALTAAETGHLVFATLHTQDAAQTIDRIIDVFPPHQQQQVRAQLSMSLQGVVCQTLAKTADGHGRIVATEVMVVTPAIRNLIREGKTHQIYSVMQAGAAHGMHTLDQHLAELVRTRKITYETGVEKCHHIEDFNRLCGRA